MSGSSSPSGSDDPVTPTPTAPTAPTTPTYDYVVIAPGNADPSGKVYPIGTLITDAAVITSLDLAGVTWAVRIPTSAGS